MSEQFDPYQEISAELMSRYAYRCHWQQVYQTLKIEHPQPGSISWNSDVDALHGEYVRKAVEQKRPIHAENKIDYRKYIPALVWYTTNGNLSVYDHVQREIFPTLQHAANQKREEYRKAVAFEEMLEARRIARSPLRRFGKLG